ncbi:hypothetical protein [Thiobacillus sp.]
MATQDIFLGRQPILDRDQRIVAYELLFRSGNTTGVTVTDDMQATASVIHHAFSEMGVQTVLDTQLGYINVSADMLLADIVGELGLSERLTAALAHREGEMGRLLQLVKSVEQPDLSHTLSLLARSGALSLSDLTAAEIEAMSWANQVAEATP